MTVVCFGRELVTGVDRRVDWGVGVSLDFVVKFPLKLLESAWIFTTCPVGRCILRVRDVNVSYPIAAIYLVSTEETSLLEQVKLVER